MRLVFVDAGDGAPGLAEMAALAGALRGMSPGRLFASPAAIETGAAAALGRELGVDVVAETALAEADFGPVADKASEKAVAKVKAEWLDGDLSSGIDGAETGLNVVDRLNSLLKRLRGEIGESETAILLSHSVALRTALPRLLTGLSTTIAQVSLGTGDLVIAELVNRRFVARRWGRVEIDA